MDVDHPDLIARVEGAFLLQKDPPLQTAPGPSANQLLAAIPATEWARIVPALETIERPLGKVLCGSGSKMNHVYFPTHSHRCGNEQTPRRIGQTVSAPVACWRPHPSGNTGMRLNTLSLVLGTTAVALGLPLLTACGKTEPVTTPPAATTTVGTVIDDSVLTTQVKAALLADPSIQSLDIKVETRKGEVQLSGLANDRDQIERAQAVARDTVGVVKVDNAMSVAVGTDTLGKRIDDSVITGKVKAGLLGDDHIKSLDIAVVTRNGEVQLSGFVNNQGQIDRSMALARGIEGVKHVQSALSIKK